MASTNYRYETFKSRYAGYDCEVVRVDAVDYYAISRLPKDPTGLIAFQNSQEKATQELKRLLGKEYRTCKITIKAVNISGAKLLEKNA